jgi:hypothetical protein
MSELKCLICENRAAFNIRTNSIFNYNENAFYIDAIYCLAHYREELKRIYDEVGTSMTPDYQGLNVRKEIQSSAGTVQVIEQKMKEVMESVIIKPVIEPEEEEEVPMTKVMTAVTKVSPNKMRQKMFEDQVLYAHNILHMTKSYDIANYIHRSRGSVYNAMRRLGLAAKSTKKGYSTPKEKDE